MQLKPYHLLTCCLVLLWGCWSSGDPHAGVTSTGNAGDIAGTVYVGQAAGLAKRGMALAADSVVDSVLVCLHDERGHLVDSMRTTREGAFWFRELVPGRYHLKAVLGSDSSGLDSIVIKKGESFQAVLPLDEEGEEAPGGSHPVGLYAATGGRVRQVVHLHYAYDSAQAKIAVTRGADSSEIQGRWMVAFEAPEMILRNTDQSFCTRGARFFSLAPGVVQGNNWFFNGDMADLYASDLGTCEQPLAALPEMHLLGMNGLELFFSDTADLKAAFYDGDWCFADHFDLDALYANAIPAGSSLERRDCSSARVLGSAGDTTILRVLWYDPVNQASIEEIRQGDSFCVRKGLLSAFGESPCQL